MFSHESIPLIALFVVMLLCVLAVFTHPVHAFWHWIQRRRSRTVLKRKEPVR